jgi:hypothetical protein
MPEYSPKGVAKIAILIARILAAPDAQFKPPTSVLPRVARVAGRI